MSAALRRPGPRRVGERPMVAVLDESLFRRERIFVPLWVTLTGRACSAVRRLMVALVVGLVRYRRASLAGFAALVVWSRWGLDALVWTLTILATITGLLLATWAWRSPISYAHRVAQPVRGWWRWRTVYRPRWRQGMHACGLLAVRDGYELLPRVAMIRSNQLADVLHVRLGFGQTPDQLAGAGEGMRHIWGAYRCSVRETSPGWCIVRFFHRDALTHTVAPASIPDLTSVMLPSGASEPTGADALAALSHLRLGQAEDGTPWLLDLVATHVLVAGATGAGKGSVLWSIVRLLAPWVRAGLVRLVVIDPKGGMEFAFGRRLFDGYADGDPAAMVGLLEDEANAMDARTSRLAGHVRSHIPTVDDPFTVVIVDEVADLTAHAPDAATKKRAVSAISRLLGKGRAPGYCLIAAALDPRKEVLPFRDLFPTRIALRLREPEQADLVLGDGALDRGADCSRIPRNLPGIGYIHDESTADPHPVRVRASHITDAEITRVVDTYGRPGPSTGHGQDRSAS